MTTKIRLYDTVEYLTTKEEMAAYLEAALESGESSLVIQALSSIAKARGISEIAKDTGLRRDVICKALSPDGAPEFAAISIKNSKKSQTDSPRHCDERLFGAKKQSPGYTQNGCEVRGLLRRGSAPRNDG